MSYSGDFQTAVELATGKVREAGYTDLTSRSEYSDPLLFRIDHYTSTPQDLVVEAFPSRQALIKNIRDGLVQQFNAGPLNLRKVFAPFMAQVFSALELE